MQAFFPYCRDLSKGSHGLDEEHQGPGCKARWVLFCQAVLADTGGQFPPTSMAKVSWRSSIFLQTAATLVVSKTPTIPGKMGRWPLLDKGLVLPEFSTKVLPSVTKCLLVFQIHSCIATWSRTCSTIPIAGSLFSDEWSSSSPMVCGQCTT